MPFIILKDNAGELVINTDQIAMITQTTLSPPAYSLTMSSGDTAPTNLNAREYAELKTLLNAEAFPQSDAVKLNERMNQVR